MSNIGGLDRLASAARLEASKMPSGADLVVANNSETILTKEQAIGVDNALGQPAHSGFSGSPNVNINLSVLDPSSIDQDLINSIGRKIAQGVVSAIDKTIGNSSLQYIGV